MLLLWNGLEREFHLRMLPRRNSPGTAPPAVPQHPFRLRVFHLRRIVPRVNLVIARRQSPELEMPRSPAHHSLAVANRHYGAGSRLPIRINHVAFDGTTIVAQDDF